MHEGRNAALVTDTSLSDKPVSAPTAILLIDLINHFEYPDGRALLEQTEKILPGLLMLKQRAAAEGLPVIYVNDNFGQWRSDFRRLMDYCTRPGLPGAEFVRRILPGDDDYLVLKPRHSAFYLTPLDLLLEYLQVRSVVLAGVSTDSCVLYTAHDANMRKFEIKIPNDCTAAYTAARHRRALSILSTLNRATVGPLAKLSLFPDSHASGEGADGVTREREQPA